MRKFVVCIVTVVITCFISTAFASVEEAITFMDISWDERAYSYLTKIRTELEYKDAIPDIGEFKNYGAIVYYDPNRRDLVKEENCGYRFDVSIPKKLKVAGYPVLGITGKAIFDVMNGSVNENPVSSRVIEVYYIFNSDLIKDARDAVEDIENKLTKLYGESDGRIEEKKKDGCTTINNQWRGMNSYVAFDASVNEENNFEYLYIYYGVDGSDQLIDLIRNPEKTLSETEPITNIDPEDTDGL